MLLKTNSVSVPSSLVVNEMCVVAIKVQSQPQCFYFGFEVIFLQIFQIYSTVYTVCVCVLCPYN